MKEVTELLYEINETLKKVNTETFYKTYEPFFQFGFTIIAVFLGAAVAYFYTRKQSQKDNTLYEEYHRILLETVNELVDFNLIINITDNMQRNAINSYYFIKKEIREKYDTIIKKIYKYSTDNMKGFNIEDFKKELVEYIKERNNAMLKL